jgi:hypothetical protein
MVSWHKKGGQWIPPSVEALNGIVTLIIDLWVNTIAASIIFKI